MNTIEELAVERYLRQRELPAQKRIPAENYIDWAQFGAREGERLMKEKAIEAFCDEMNKENVMCKLSKQCDMACRDTCPAYESFMNALS